uniref:Uncharacterized protein n=1 Tax=viral metagenome TaxID=1070528 RepID=A0A6H1ZGH7_9ZZZZ
MGQNYDCLVKMLRKIDPELAEQFKKTLPSDHPDCDGQCLCYERGEKHEKARHPLRWSFGP